jgi:hypothetical protein
VVDFLRKQRHPLSIDDESVDPSLLRDKATPADRQLEMSEVAGFLWTGESSS